MVDPGQSKRHWAALTALIIGIVAVLLSLIPAVGFLTTAILAPIGIVFAIIGILNTGAGKAAGRGMALTGLILVIAAIAIAVVWLFIVNLAVNKSLDDIYGTPASTEGPGRNPGAAIPFGTTSDYPNGMKITATPPVTSETSQELENRNYNVSWSTTITYSNSGSEGVRVQPIGRGSLVEGGQVLDCTVTNNAPLAAVDSPLTTMQPGESKKIDAVFSCHAADPLGVITIQLSAAPEPYESQTYFRGPLDDGETR